MFSQEEIRELFPKLKIRTLLDLALTLPRAYDDNRLSKSLNLGEVATIEAVVESSFLSRGSLRVKFFLPKFSRVIYGVIFRATNYYYKIYTKESHHIIQGKIGKFRGDIQIVQPKSLKSYGEVIPRYKRKVGEERLKKLIRELISKETLAREGLKIEEIEAILSLHFPEKSREKPSTDYSKDLIETLKGVEAFNHIKKLNSKRQFYRATKSLKGDISKFLARVPFELTDDQKRVIREIRADLADESIATKRVIIGDVGSGKTMVIFASAMVANSEKSILMAPTSILANQLYDEAERYLSQSLNLALITQNRREGDIFEADFIIGTHALLYQKNLPKVALIMVDEQHRFGSKQRSLLEKISTIGEKKAHYLQFSATPIPRTQAMIDSAIVDVSLIEERPFKRTVHSKVIGKNEFKELILHIESELKKEHQVALIYPLVEESSKIPYLSIDEAREFWESRYRGVFVTHGRDKKRDEVLKNFRDNGRVLLATTVVEVGISLPKLTTIVVVGAERLGLASLHQLRGRVGRNGLESWCFLYTNLAKPPKKLIEFCSTENGFEIARLDLLYRKGGDILDGTVQSGASFRWLNLATDEEIVKEALERVEKLNNKKEIR